MWHKAEWMGHPMRLDLTRVGLLVQYTNHYNTRGALILSILLSIWLVLMAFMIIIIIIIIYSFRVFHISVNW